MADYEFLAEAERRGLLNESQKKVVDVARARGLMPDVTMQETGIDRNRLNQAFMFGFSEDEEEDAKAYNLIHLNDVLQKPQGKGTYEDAAKEYYESDNIPNALAFAARMKTILEKKAAKDEFEEFIDLPAEEQENALYQRYKEELDGKRLPLPPMSQQTQRLVDEEAKMDRWAAYGDKVKAKYRKKYLAELLDKSPKMRLAQVSQELSDSTQRWAERAYLTRAFEIAPFMKLDKRQQQLALDYIDIMQQETDYAKGKGLERLKDWENYEVLARIAKRGGLILGSLNTVRKQQYGPMADGEALLNFMQKNFGKDLTYQGQPLLTDESISGDPGLKGEMRWADPAALQAVQRAMEKDIRQTHFGYRSFDQAFDWVEKELPQKFAEAQQAFEEKKALRRVRSATDIRFKDDWSPRSIALANLEVGMEMGLTLGLAYAGGPGAAGTYSAARFYGEFRDELVYERGVSMDQAHAIAIVAALPYTLIEYSQVTKLKPLQKEFTKEFAKNMKRFVLETAKRRGINYAQEVGEETAQAIVEASALAFAKEFAQAKGITYEELLNQIGEETIGAIKGMVLLQGPGMTADVYHGTRASFGGSRMAKGLPMRKEQIDTTIDAANKVRMKLPIHELQTDPEEITPELKQEWRLAETTEEKKQVLIDHGIINNHARWSGIMDREIILEDIQSELASQQMPDPEIIDEVERELEEDYVDPEIILEDAANEIPMDFNEDGTARTKDVPPPTVDTPDQTDPSTSATDQQSEPAYSVEEIREEIETRGYTPSLTVVENFADLPESVRAGIKGKMEDRAYIESNIEGVSGGAQPHGYIIANNLKPGRAIPTIFHEAVAHVGLRKAFGDENYNKLLTSILSDPEILAEVKIKMRERDIHTASEQGRIEGADEFLADRAELDDFSPNIQQRIIALVRQWLRDMGLLEKEWMQKIGITDKWTDNDIRNLLSRGDKAARQESPKEDIGGAVEADTENGSIAPMDSRFSVRTWTDEVKEDIITKAKEMGIPRIKTEKWINDIDNIMARVLANPQLDFRALGADLYPVLKDNSDPHYTKSLDFSTLCRKRYVLAATIEAVQLRLGRAVEKESWVKIRNMLDKEYEVSCGACYVDSKRMEMGKYINEFIDANPDIDPELFLTQEGNDRLLRENPQLHAEFKKKILSNNSKAPESRSEYNGEILRFFEQGQDTKRNPTTRRLEWTSGKPETGAQRVKDFNKRSGLRWQSWSDFEVPHLMDAMQAIIDMAQVGLKGHAYTKVPEFVMALGKTGLMINMSLIPRGTGLDADGNLDFDPKEGMPFEVAIELRARNEMTAGTIAIGVSNEQIAKMLEDPRIDYIIPYHASGLSKDIAKTFGMGDWVDYTKTQTADIGDIEKFHSAVGHQHDKLAKLYKAKPKLRSNAAAKTREAFPALKQKWESMYIKAAKRLDILEPDFGEWWDDTRSGKENTDAYLKILADNGVLPRFRGHTFADGRTLQDFTTHPNYWKLMVDRKSFDHSGNNIAQKPVQPEYDNAALEQILDNYKPVADQAVDAIVEEFLDTANNIRFSIAPTQPDEETATVSTGHSGAGIVEIGLGRHRSLATAEFDEEIIRIHNQIHGTNYKAKDIKDVNPQDIKDKDPDLHHESPSCKNFSKANSLATATEEDYLAAKKIADIINEAKPRAFTLEQVQVYGETALFKMITDALDKQNYTWDVVYHSSADFGAPQHRNRLLVRAIIKGDLPSYEQYLKPPGDWYETIKDLIDDAPDWHVAEWEQKRLDYMIEKGRIDPTQPIFTMGGGGRGGNAAAVNPGQPTTAITSKGGAPRIILPDGTVKRVTSRMIARLFSIPDEIPLPSNFYTAKMVLGNGVQVETTQALIRPLLERSRNVRLGKEDEFGQMMLNLFPKTPPPISAEDARWPTSFPNVVQHTTVGKMKAHPAYNDAKAGDMDAAMQVVEDVMKPEKIKALADAHPTAILVPILSEEIHGRNKLPLAMAAHFYNVAGNEVSTDIVQANRTNHTIKGNAGRLISRAVFDGPVIADRDYILMDDVVTSGGTIAELRLHILRNGGRVVAVTSLGTGKFAARIAVKPESLTKLNEKYGDELDAILEEFQIAGGHKTAITESEARYLIQVKDALSLREKFNAARSEEGTSQGNEVTYEERSIDEETINDLPDTGLDEEDHTANPKYPANADQFRFSVYYGGKPTDPENRRGTLPRHTSALRKKLTKIGTVSAPNLTIDNARAAAEVLWEIRNRTQEKVVLLALDEHYNVTDGGLILLTLGTLTASQFHAKLIHQAVEATGAKKFIIAHNHPSGDPSPSKQDNQITDLMRDLYPAGGDVEFVDHVIINGGTAYSAINGYTDYVPRHLKSRIPVSMLDQFGAVGEREEDIVPVKKLNTGSLVAFYAADKFDDLISNVLVIGVDVRNQLVSAQLHTTDRVKDRINQVGVLPGVARIIVASQLRSRADVAILAKAISEAQPEGSTPNRNYAPIVDLVNVFPEDMEESVRRREFPETPIDADYMSGRQQGIVGEQAEDYRFSINPIVRRGEIHRESPYAWSYETIKKGIRPDYKETTGKQKRLTEEFKQFNKDYPGFKTTDPTASSADQRVQEIMAGNDAGAQLAQELDSQGVDPLNIIIAVIDAQRNYVETQLQAELDQQREAIERQQNSDKNAESDDDPFADPGRPVKASEAIERQRRREQMKRQIAEELKHPAENAAAVLAFRIVRGEELTLNDAKMFLDKYKLADSADYILERAYGLARGFQTDINMLKDNYTLKKAIRKNRLQAYFNKMVMEFYRTAERRGEFLQQAKDVLKARQQEVIDRRPGITWLELRDTYGIDASKYFEKEIDPTNLDEFMDQIRLAVREKMIKERVFTDRKVNIDSVPEFRRELQQTYYNILRMGIQHTQYGQRRESLFRRLENEVNARVTSSGIHNATRDLLAAIEVTMERETRDNLIKEIWRELNLKNIKRPSWKDFKGWTDKEMIAFDQSALLNFYAFATTIGQDRANELIAELAEDLKPKEENKDAEGGVMPKGFNFLQRTMDAHTKIKILEEASALRSRTQGDLRDILEKIKTIKKEGVTSQAELHESLTKKPKEFTRKLINAIGEGKKTKTKADDQGLKAAAAKHLRGYGAMHQLLMDMVKYAPPEVAKQAEDAINELYMEMGGVYADYDVAFQQTMAQFNKKVETIFGGRPIDTMHELNRPRPEYAKYSQDGTTDLSKFQLYFVYMMSIQEDLQGNLGQFINRDLLDSLLGELELGQQGKSDRDLQLINYFLKWYKETGADLDVMAKRLFGHELVKTGPNYSPARFDRGEMGIGGTIRLFNPVPGFMIPRTKHPYPIDETQSAFDLWANHVRESLWHSIGAETAVKWYLTFNDESFQDAYKKRFGYEALREFNDAVMDTLKGTPPDNGDSDPFVNWTRTWFVMTRLPGNPGSMVRQASSFMGFATEIGIIPTSKYMAEFTTAIWDEDIRDAIIDIIKSDYAKARIGTFDIEAVQALEKMPPGRLRSMLQNLMKVPGAGDLVPTLMVGQGVYRAARDRYESLGQPEPLAKRNAMRDLFVLANMSQQSSWTLNQSNFIRRGGSAQKLMTTFKTGIIQQLGKEVYSARAVVANPKSLRNWGRMGRTMLVTHVFIPGLYHLSGIFWRWATGTPPDEDDWERLGIGMLLGPWNALVYFGAMIEGITNYTLRGNYPFGDSVPAASILTEGIKFMKALKEAGNEEIPETIKNTVDVITDQLAPAREGKRIYKNITNGEE